MRFAAVVVAGGRGVRAGSGIPKQFRKVLGRPVMARSLDPILAHRAVGECVAVVARQDVRTFESEVASLFDQEIRVAEGGTTRTESVLSGLRALEGRGYTHVLVHDAVRPFLSKELLEQLIEACKKHDGAIPVAPVSDALWEVVDGSAARPVPRDGTFRAQTPQAFAFEPLLQAHLAHSGAAADDAAIAVAGGMNVAAVAGCDRNFKITVEGDFDRAERAAAVMDYRTGQGFDIHPAAEGDGVVLCGVKIPCDFSLAGHSDADAAIHAIADALYGAVAAGDIGTWFPPSDPAWKGADSAVFLKHAAERVAREGYIVTSIDCTIICERPQIAPHAADMRANLAKILGTDPARVSVKATTAERLGFIGREEGIAAMAVATVGR